MPLPLAEEYYSEAHRLDPEDPAPSATSARFTDITLVSGTKREPHLKLFSKCLQIRSRVRWLYTGWGR